MLIALAASAFLATFAGGVLALKLSDRLHLVLGFSAGAILGVTFFDLLPEALEIGVAYDPSTILAVVAASFALYLILDRTVLMHSHHGEDCHNHRGLAGAGAIVLHSFLDGAAIGLAFQVSPLLGATVALAVITHGFSDGINTVGLILKNGGTRTTAYRWLALDAIAPAFGVLSSLLITLSVDSLSLVLATFAGFFIYIGASELIPEGHHSHSVGWTTAMTVLGMATLYAVITLAGV